MTLKRQKRTWLRKQSQQINYPPAQQAQTQSNNCPYEGEHQRSKYFRASKAKHTAENQP